VLGATFLLTRCAPAPEAERGARQIARYGCGTCHTIGGIAGAHGLVGPPLDSLPSRMYIAGVLPNNTTNFVRWVQDPKAVDEKTAMPALGVTESDANHIAAFIYSKH
jgi:cytochrome c